MTTPEDIAADFLGDYGVGRLDLLVLTHFHADHANGVTELLKRVQVDTLAIPPATGEEEPLRDEILSVAEARDVEVLEVEEDTLLTLDEDRTIQLYAPLGAGETNEAGLTCLISTGDFDTLITGDMGADVEQQLLTHTDLPDLEVLVAGHHGSKSSTSEQLLAATAPDYAFLSVGEHNTYGHPAQETLERLQRQAAASTAPTCREILPCAWEQRWRPNDQIHNKEARVMPPKAKADTAGYQKLKKDLVGGHAGAALSSPRGGDLLEGLLPGEAPGEGAGRRAGGVQLPPHRRQGYVSPRPGRGHRLPAHDGGAHPGAGHRF